MGMHVQMVPGKPQGHSKQGLKVISVIYSRRNVLHGFAGRDCHEPLMRPTGSSHAHLTVAPGQQAGQQAHSHPGPSDARLPSFRQEEKPPYKAECTGILHHRCAFAGKRGSHEEHKKRERQKEGRERRDGVHENEKERRGGALHECFASIIKEIA